MIKEFHYKTAKTRNVLIDDEDEEIFNRHKWTIILKGKKFHVRNEDGKLFYRLIMDVPAGAYVKYLDGDPLNNQKINLQIVTAQERNRNKSSKKNSTSVFKGVSKSKGDTKFRSEITVNYKRIHLGYFKTSNEAAVAYNKAALEYFGPGCRLNKL